jgi:hypothetical protein
MTEFRSLFRREIFFLVRVQVLLHLFYDMFSFVEVLNIQICRAPGNLLGMATQRAELPFLETVHVRERTARGAPDDEVHDIEVIGVIVINKYRRFAEKAGNPTETASPIKDRPNRKAGTSATPANGQTLTYFACFGFGKVADPDVLNLSLMRHYTRYFSKIPRLQSKPLYRTVAP